MAGSPESALTQASELLNAVAQEARRTLKHADATQVHHLRVAIRRFSQALNVIEPPKAGKIQRKLKRILKLAGEVRDYDIAARLSGKLNAPAGLRAKLRRLRSKGESSLLDSLRRWVDRRTAAKWAATLRGAPRSARAGHALLLRETKILFDRGAKAGHSMKALHRLRIAAKKLRYTMELAASVSADKLERIKSLQTHLGDINDIETARRIVAGLGASKRLVEQLRQKQTSRVRKFRRYWSTEFAGRQSEWIRAK
jgi:CHAD domain-containing protein